MFGPAREAGIPMFRRAQARPRLNSVEQAELNRLNIQSLVGPTLAMVRQEWKRIHSVAENLILGNEKNVVRVWIGPQS